MTPEISRKIEQISISWKRDIMLREQPMMQFEQRRLSTIQRRTWTQARQKIKRSKSSIRMDFRGPAIWQKAREYMMKTMTTTVPPMTYLTHSHSLVHMNSSIIFNYCHFFKQNLMQAIIAARRMTKRSRSNSPQINSQNVIISVLTLVLGITVPVWSLSLLKQIHLDALQILSGLANGIFLASNLLFVILVFDCLQERIWGIYIFLFEMYFPLAVATLIILIIHPEEPTFFVFNSALLCLSGVVTLIVLILRAVYKEFAFREVFIIFYMGYYYIFVGWFIELVKACHRCRRPKLDTTTQLDPRVNMTSQADMEPSFQEADQSEPRLRNLLKNKRPQFNDQLYCDVCADTARKNQVISFQGCVHRFHKRCVGEACPFCRRPAPLNIE